MTPQTNFVVVPSLWQTFRVPEGAAVAASDGKYVMYETDENSAATFAMEMSELTGRKSVRILDRVYFFLNANSSIMGADIYFSLLAGAYSSAVDMERNLACARMLLRIGAGEMVASPVRCLDFGCGAGSGLGTLSKEGADVVGYDACPAMVELCRQQGYKVVASLAELADRSLDLVIACYVLHFEVSKLSFKEMSRLLVLGGKVVANCHKGLGLQNSVSHLLDAGFSCRVLDDIDGGRFGNIIFAERVR